MNTLFEQPQASPVKTNFIVIGSQSILGKFPDAPRSLRHSMELDLYPKEHPEMTELISGCLGEYSTFHDTFKYYADGVSPTTATLPSGWQERLTRFSNDNMNGAVAHCLDPLDPAYAKLAAGRPKDLDYIEELARHHFIKPSAFTKLIEQTEDGTLKRTLTERWRVIQGKRLAVEKPSVRPPDHGMGGI